MLSFNSKLSNRRPTRKREPTAANWTNRSSRLNTSHNHGWKKFAVGMVVETTTAVGEEGAIVTMTEDGLMGLPIVVAGEDRRMVIVDTTETVGKTEIDMGDMIEIAGQEALVTGVVLAVDLVVREATEALQGTAIATEALLVGEPAAAMMIDTTRADVGEALLETTLAEIPTAAHLPWITGIGIVDIVHKLLKVSR